MLLSIPKVVVTAKVATNYVFCVDVSGSMYSTLPKLRTALKNKVSTLIGLDDTFSIIWFSGKNEAGFVFEDFQLNSIASLEATKTGIDRYLTAQCLTAFDKPLVLAATKVDPKRSNVLAFFTDGWNNSASSSDVFKALDGVKGKFNAYHFVEFGYYCDSKLIGEMANIVGGTQSVAKDFNDLELSVTEFATSTALPRIEVQSFSDIVFGCDGENFVTYPVENGIALVDPNTALLSDGNLKRDSSIMECLIVAYGESLRGNWGQVEVAVLQIGDSDLIKKFSAAYGKGKIVEFREYLLDAIKGDITLLPVEGLTIDENAFCVMDLLEILTNNEGNFFYPSELNYTRIGVAKGAKVGEATTKAVSAADFLGLRDLSPIKTPLFIAHNPKEGTALSKLVFNTERANVSIQTCTGGKVINLPNNEWNVTEWQSQIFRNYTIIKDGIINTPILPVTVTPETFALIPSELFTDNGDKDLLFLDISSIPVINRRRIKALTAVETAQKGIERLKVQAALKVLKHFDETSTAVSGVEPELAAFLKEQGITEMGYSPKTESFPSGDFYFAPSLKLKFAGASSLPSVKAVVEKSKKIAEAILANKKAPKLNLGDELISAALNLVAATPHTEIPAFRKRVDELKRKLDVELAQIASTLILSRGWFSDKKDFDDTVVTLSPEIVCTLCFEDVQEKL